MFPNDSDFESEFTFENAAVPLPEVPPFHALILGDWSGGTNIKDLYERQAIVIDRDNFDDVLKKLNVGLHLDLSGDENNFLHLQFSELDDFHPDNIFRNVPLFSELRDVRRRLTNQDTFDNAANEVRSWFFSTSENFVNDSEIQSQIDDSPPIDSNNLLDMILTQTNSSATSGKPLIVDNSELGRFVSKIVSSHLIKIDEDEQSKLIAAVDETISELMRTILHHSQFQALESAWRGLYFLVKRLETSPDLKVFIFDVSQQDLTDNLKSVNNLNDCFLYHQLAIESFSIIAGNYSFGISVDDIASLMRIGKLANDFNSPFISYFKPEIFGVKNFLEQNEAFNFDVLEDSKEGKLWKALRLSPEANFIGLSPMRILMRMPYGLATDSIETFTFEEFKEDVNSENLLWTNPCFAIVLLFGQSFSLNGWDMTENFLRNIENLPFYIYRKNGDLKTVPCAEIVLTENILEKILAQGLMPFISYRDCSNIRLASFQSISLSKTKLGTFWNY
jgi:type VI secretion system protein ImpC